MLFCILIFRLGILGQAAANNQANSVVDKTAKSLEESDGFFNIVFSGGILGIGIMLSLIMLSLVTVYLIVDQALTLRRKDIVPTDFTEKVRGLISQGRLKDADQLCREQPSPLAFIVSSGIAEVEFGWPSVEKALEDTTMEQSARLYRKVEYLSVLGNLAPMLGLLGTVSGMILAFRQVALSQGAAGAGELAQGIYSALVTTVAGLIIAIPAMGAFAIYRNRIDQLIAEVAHSAQHIFAPIRRRLPGANIARPTSIASGISPGSIGSNQGSSSLGGSNTPPRTPPSS